MEYQFKKTRPDGSKMYCLSLEEQDRLMHEAADRGDFSTTKIVTSYVIFPKAYNGKIAMENFSIGAGCDSVTISELPANVNLID